MERDTETTGRIVLLLKRKDREFRPYYTKIERNRLFYVVFTITQSILGSLVLRFSRTHEDTEPLP